MMLLNAGATKELVLCCLCSVKRSACHSLPLCPFFEGVSPISGLGLCIGKGKDCAHKLSSF
jgi:hypothetical protein